MYVLTVQYFAEMAKNTCINIIEKAAQHRPTDY